MIMMVIRAEITIGTRPPGFPDNQDSGLMTECFASSLRTGSDDSHDAGLILESAMRVWYRKDEIKAS